MARVGFLHTADQHVATFRALVRDLAPELEEVHVVDPDLLASARRDGVDERLRRRLRERLAEIDADLVVCTCSTLGPEAEALGALRVDRPMAEQAVATGGRVTVLAALASTLEPTRALLEDAGAAAVDVVLCDDAWTAFEKGDTVAYLVELEACARSAVGADVLVLAQASMAPLVERLADLEIPVLASPRLAVERIAELLARPGGA